MSSVTASIGVVTPSYNQSAFVAETVNSILDQDYAALRYVVVNDGSTDNTSAVISTITGNFHFIEQSNRGQVNTLNEQWAALDTKYLAYLSSDDLLSPQAFSKAIAILEREPSVACVFPDCNLIDQNGRIIKRSVSRPFDLEDTLVTQICTIGPGAVFRKADLEAVGGWRNDIPLAPDWEFWIRLSRVGEIRFLAEPLASYRLHTGSYSVREVSTERSLDYVRVLDAYFSSSPHPSILKRREEAYGNAYMVVARNAFRRGDLREGLRFVRLAHSLYPGVARPGRLVRLAREVVSKPLRIMAGKLRGGRLT